MGFTLPAPDYVVKTECEEFSGFTGIQITGNNLNVVYKPQGVYTDQIIIPVLTKFVMDGGNLVTLSESMLNNLLADQASQISVNV